ncbi:2603_t:CDS:2 [Racocetra fulgida]|uniref:2603_t:CDS:1 n=1 Tax=Racocetra fulgida TaxID=60492 RepID=A0A9N8ZQ34_9GLOM|nr:2603_t:CDS:2 [Racocetra fulgida]
MVIQKIIDTNESDSENNSDSILPSTTISTNTKKKIKKRKIKSRKSFVCDYFKVIGSKYVCQIIIKKYVIDKKCEAEYLHDNSISNMIVHLQSSHNIVDPKKLNAEIQRAQQTILPKIVKNDIPYKGNKLDELNKTVVEWIILDNQLLSAPRNKGFRHMIAKVDQDFVHLQIEQ